MTRQIGAFGRRDVLKLGAAALALPYVRPIYAETKHFDVIVIGAGLAGLETTRLLERSGANVALIEASDRVGGRVHTLDELEGRPEAGGTQAGTGYPTLNRIAPELGVEFTPIRAAAPGQCLSINGQLLDIDAWPESPANVLTGSLRSVQPRALLSNIIGKGRQLSSPTEFNNAANAPLDISLSAHLSELGADKESLRLINANLNGAGIDQVSAADVLRKISVLRQSGGPVLIEGGSQRLPDAIHSEIKRDVYFEKPVTKIRDSGTSVIVTCQDNDQFSANHCVVTVPFSVLRKVDIDAALLAGQSSRDQEPRVYPSNDCFTKTPS